MRNCLLGLLVIVCLAGSGTLRAQPRQSPGSGRWFRMPLPLYLMTALEVRQELALTQEQQELVNDLQADLQDQMEALTRPAPTQGGSEADQRTRRGKVEKLYRQGEELVRAVLEPSQNERLSQLVVQKDGPRAFNRPEFSAALKLTDEQQEQIKKLLKENMGATSRLQLQVTISKLLTPEQREQWSKLKGPPFEFPNGIPGLGRPGGGRGPAD